MPYYSPGGVEDDFTTQAYSSLGLTLGPAFLGVGIDMLCLGIILCQFTVWKVRLEKDERWSLRGLVYWITAGSIGHTIFCQAFGWSIFVSGFGDPHSLLRGWWVKGDCLFELLLAMPIEVLYALRAYQLWGKPRIMLILLSILFLGSIGLGISNLLLGAADPVSSTTSPMFIAWVSSLFCIDWALSALIMVALYKKRSGVQHTDKIVLRIIVLSAEAQFIPSLVTAGLVIKALAAPTSLIVLVFIFVPKVWVITAMIVINFRQTLRHDMETERERRQNTLNFMSTEIDGQRPTAQTQSESAVAVPTLSLTGPSDPISPISEKSGFSYTPAIPVSDTTFNPMTSTTSGSSVPRTPTIGDRLEVSIVQERRSSVGLRLGGGLGRFKSRSNTVGEEEGEMTFEEMLKAR